MGCVSGSVRAVAGITRSPAPTDMQAHVFLGTDALFTLGHVLDYRQEQ